MFSPASPALAALRKGDAATARRLARKAVAARPEDPNAHRIASEVEFQCGDYETALREAREAMRLAGPGDLRVMLTAVRVQTFADRGEALKTAREMLAAGPEAANAVLLADLTLFDATARGIRGEQARGTAQEVRVLLEPYRERVEGDPLLGDFEAVVGNSYLLEGDLARARQHLEKALQAGVDMPDRVTDLGAALAWVAFQQGDPKGAARFYGLALEALKEHGMGDAFQFLPKWENFVLLRAAFAGEGSSPLDVGGLDGLRREMERRGFSDLLTYREDRQLCAALADAWDRADYGQAFYLLAWKTLPLPDDPEVEARSPNLRGESRLAPACFYQATVAQPAQEAFRPVFLGRVAERAGRPELARFWYDKALELLPGNRILAQRLKGLPQGAPPPDLGAPGAADTLRLLQRFARRGWVAPLFDGLQGLQARGVTLLEFERQVREEAPRYREIADLLDRSVKALDEGASLRESPLEQPVPEEEWTDVARLELPGGAGIVLHREDRLWVVTGAPALGEFDP